MLDRRTPRPRVSPPEQLELDLDPLDGDGTGSGTSILARRVQGLLARGKLREAVQMAKAAFKRNPCEATERVLAASYVTRILHFGPGLRAEAFALLDVAQERCPGSRADLERLRSRLLARFGLFDELLAPLAEPEPAPEAVAASLEALRCEAVALEALAATSALPPTHDLRVAAAAVHRAFEAVTSRPVSDEDIALPEVSRRSPLAPWKLLVRAIACLYRGDHGGAEQALEALPADAAPSRLVPALRGLLSGGKKGVASRTVDALVNAVLGGSRKLEAAQTELDEAFDEDDPKRALRAMASAVSHCEKNRPEFVDRLKQHYWVRCLCEDVPPDELSRVMPFVLKDAAFWRLWARASATTRSALAAVTLWEEFRRNAINENWFSETSAEAAAVDLRMVDILDHHPEGAIEDIALHCRGDRAGYSGLYTDQPSEIQRAAPPSAGIASICFDRGRLLERAAHAHPTPELFGRWLDWARRSKRSKLIQRVARAWSKALPGDSRPHLVLVELHDERNDVDAALRSLEQAERLDPLSPHVRHTRLRLLGNSLVRRLGKNRLRGVRNHLAMLEQLPYAREGLRPAFAAALRWVLSCKQKDGEAGRWRDETARLLNSPLAATALLEQVGRASAVDPTSVEKLARPGRGERLLPALAKACTVAAEFAFPMGVPQLWVERLGRELGRQRLSASTRELILLAEAALQSGAKKLAYHACGAGLAAGDEQAARLLGLRGQSMPDGHEQRAAVCLAAAAELARRSRDLKLAAEMVDCCRSTLAWDGEGVETVNVPTLNDSELEDVLERERKTARYPRSRQRLPRERYCDCPDCRARRGEPDAEWGWDDEDEDDLDFAFDEVMDGPTENAARELAELLAGKVLEYAAQSGQPPSDEELYNDPELRRRLDAWQKRNAAAVAGPRKKSKSGRKKKSKKRR